MKKTKDLFIGLLTAILIGGVCVFLYEKTKEGVMKKYTVKDIKNTYSTIISKDNGYNSVRYHTTCFVYLKGIEGASDTLLLLKPVDVWMIQEGQEVILFVDK